MIRGIFRLVRVSSFATAPSDVLAGYLLATPLSEGVAAGRLAALSVASLLLYWGGLIVNDLRDLDEDARWRPDRPLPSGEVSPGTARVLAVTAYGVALTLAWSVGIAAGMIATAIAVLSVAYSLVLRRSDIGAAFGMGTCRALVFLLGAAGTATPRAVPPLLLVGGLYFAYIAALTLVARGESRPIPGGRAASLAFGAAAVPLALGGGLVLASPASPVLRAAGLVPLVFLAATLARRGIAFRRDDSPRRIQVFVRDGVLGILFWNAGLLLAFGRPLFAGAVLLAFLASRRLSSAFTPS
jgi:4-hydroxybenzoate polyprenyltransferase